jgi:peptidoglycan/LPS O-acetylase OafA/YrhL
MVPLRRHTNAFDLIRLVAAGLVLWSHQHALMGMHEPFVAVLGASYGGLGLYIFFALSGYLNTGSLAQHHSMQVYLFNRALRIYPALAACVVFTVILGFLVATDRDAYVSVKLLSYIAKNVTLFSGVKMGVPGVFESNAFPHALNGSLWTLPYEVKMYVVLAVSLGVARYNLALPIIALVGGCVIVLLGTAGLLPVLPRNDFWVIFSVLFLAGSAVAAAKSFVGLPVAIGALAAIALAFAGIGEQLLAWLLLLTAIVIAVGSITLPKRLRLPLDLSYGLSNSAAQRDPVHRLLAGAGIFGGHYFCLGAGVGAVHRAICAPIEKPRGHSLARQAIRSSSSDSRRRSAGEDQL